MTRYGSNQKAPLVGAFLFLGLLALPGCAEALKNTVKVQHVIDGDTVVLENGDKVRLLGINAPEKEFEDRAAQPFSLEALLSLRELVEHKSVYLTVGNAKKDKYGRTLGYLDLKNGTDVQEQLLLEGYAMAVAFPPDIDRLERYELAEDTARKQQRGVWNSSFWLPRNVDKSIPLNSGFAIFSGYVKKVSTSKKNVLFTMDSGLNLTVRHDAWKAFWGTNPDALIGQVVEARGWASEGRNNFKGKFFLRIRHPFMLRVLKHN